MMSIDNPAGIDETGELSVEDATKAFANLGSTSEPDEGQAEDDQGAVEEGDEAPVSEEDEDGATENEETDQEEDGEADAAAETYALNEQKVKLPGGEEVTVADLISGNLRDRDYRQKTMETSELRKSLEADRQQVHQFAEEQLQAREFLMQMLQSSLPPEPKRDAYQGDIVGYLEDKAAYDERVAALRNLYGQNESARSVMQAEQAKAMKERKDAEWVKTLEAMPELRNEKKLSAFVSDIRSHTAEYGFAPQELEAVAMDHRMAVVLRDAIAYRKLQSAKPKAAAKVENRPPVQRAGQRTSAGDQRAQDKRTAMDRLKRSGSVKDAIAAVLAIEKG